MTIHPRPSAFICGLLLFSAAASAWPGHKWEDWQLVTTWTKSDVKTPQAGRKNLAPLLISAGRPVDEIRAWEARREEIAATITRVFGQPSWGSLQPADPLALRSGLVTENPLASRSGLVTDNPLALRLGLVKSGSITRPAVVAEVLGEETLPDHVRRHVRIRGEADEWIPAYVLLPRDLAARGAPVMICLHQTSAQGKDEPAGIKGDTELALGLQLVRRGFVCICPDAIGFGERIRPGGQPYDNAIAFYRRHPGWSFAGKMIWDVSRVVDYLETLPHVEPLQIGCIGHSHGAYGTLFAAAFEPRISLAVASCGFNTFRADPTPNRWSHLTALIPQVGTYLPSAEEIPFDWHELVALIAPRPLFVWNATQDACFPNTAGLDAVFKDVRGVYGLYGAADDLTYAPFDGPHKFPPDARERAYRWIEERFSRSGDLHTRPSDTAAWEIQRKQLKHVIARTLGLSEAGDRPAVASQPALPAPDVRVISTETLPKYERRLIEYAVDSGERVRAYLCVPRDVTGPWPGVLVLHQTTAEGKREAVGLAGERSLAFAADLAERGCVTLAPDSITAGERIDRFGAFDTRGHYLRQPNLSAMGKMILDARRALDVLAATDGVDPARLGAIGHSLGAEEALMLAAFDDGVRATVASCGFATFRAESDPGRWARDHWFTYMPKLRPIFQLGRQPAWDWDDVIRSVAPRGLYLHNTRSDKIFPESQSAYDAAEAARAIWQLYDAPADRLMNVMKPGAHAVADDTRADMYAWLSRQLQQ